MEAPLCVPVELSRSGDDSPAPRRWFRLAVAICPTHLRLRRAVPEELAEGPVAVRLHLPLDLDPPPPPLSLTAVAAEAVVDEGEETERAELRLLVFAGLGERDRALIDCYLQSHLALDPSAADG
ncbi:MAG: hypothetical protein RMK29_13715 [Myxococcales bacterium]|nr:hypothetical protein [Myxococcales bacterium]